jgi:hypothetical protein
MGKSNTKVWDLVPPKALRERVGCKVEWRVYAAENDARIAAKIATLWAEEKERQGYGFGLQCPGSITKVADGWEVCFP